MYCLNCAGPALLLGCGLRSVHSIRSAKLRCPLTNDHQNNKNQSQMTDWLTFTKFLCRICFIIPWRWRSPESDQDKLIELSSALIGMWIITTALAPPM